MFLDQDGNLEVVTGDLRMVASGKGVDFSGVGTAGEILHDYEEGTFTPELWDDGLNDDSATYNAQVGSYTRIGDMCFFQAYLDVATTTGLTGGDGAKIGSLPFTAANVSNQAWSVCSGVGQNLALGTASAVTGYVAPNTAYVNLTNWDGTGGHSLTSITEFSGDGNINVTGFYKVA
jgi:hypothetical protein